MKLEFEQNGVVFFRSRAGGICGTLMASLAHGRDLAGATAKADVVGLTMARLWTYLGVRAVHAAQISEDARDALLDGGVALAVDEVGPNAAMADWERRMELEFGPRRPVIAVFEALKSRLMTVLDNHAQPIDANLWEVYPSRLGRGGGGT